MHPLMLTLYIHCMCTKRTHTCPHCVYIISSFSLDVNDSNHGHKVFGYLVYVDEQLWAESPGPLSSQVELDGLKHSTEYHIQVW